MAVDGQSMTPPGSVPGIAPRGPTVLRVCTLGVRMHDRYGMENRQALRRSGRPPGSPKPRLSKMSNAGLYNALRGNLLGACQAIQDGDSRDRIIALVRAQRLAARLVERLERREGRAVHIIDDDRDISVIRLPADLVPPAEPWAEQQEDEA